jgi:hypothetical protein
MIILSKVSLVSISTVLHNNGYSPQIFIQNKKPTKKDNQHDTKTKVDNFYISWQPD